MTITDDLRTVRCFSYEHRKAVEPCRPCIALAKLEEKP